MDEVNYFKRIAEYRLYAKKEVGQNFLVDPRVAERIVSLLGLQKGDEAIEIGSGAGSLSFFLEQSEANCRLIDIDEGLIAKLQNDFPKSKNLSIERENALQTDYAKYEKIIGNLPYYITSSLVERVLLTADNASKIVFMVQKEAAVRLLSAPGTKDYGPLNVLLSLYGIPKREFNVGTEAFVPAPHVNSTVISITPHHLYGDIDRKEVYHFFCHIFQKRRKTILNNLKSLTPEAEKLLKGVGVPPKKRPEEIRPEEYLKLYYALKGEGNNAI